MSPFQRFFLAVFLLTIIYLFGLGFLAYSVYVLVGVLVTSWLMSRHALTDIEHVRTVSRKRCDVGESINVSVEICNNKTLPVVWVLAEDFAPERLPHKGERVKVLSLRAGQTVVLKYEVECIYRGYHAMGPLLLESGDLFGLSRRFRTGKQIEYITVLPQVVPIISYGIHTHRPIGEVRVETQIYEDPTRIAGVREYTRGDALNRIHWKATARTGILHSKVYDPTTMIGANLVLDFHENAYIEPKAFERSELAVTATASIAAFILEQKQQVGFLSNGRDAIDRIREEREEVEVTNRAEARRLATEESTSDRLRPVEVRTRRGEGQFEQIMVALARLEKTNGLTLGEMLLSEYNRFPRDAAMVIICGQIDALLLDVLVEMRRSGFVVAVFLIDNEREWESAVLRLAPERIQCYHIRNERDLSDLSIATL